MKGQPDVYVWFEFNRYQVVPEVEDGLFLANYQDDEEDNYDSENFTLDLGGSFVARVHGKIVGNRYFFSFLNAGWRNICFRVFIEMSEDPEVELINLSHPGLIRTIYDMGYDYENETKNSANIKEMEESGSSSEFDNFCDSEETDESSQKYLIGLMAPESYCRIDGVIYSSQIMFESLKTFFILSPQK